MLLTIMRLLLVFSSLLLFSCPLHASPVPDDLLIVPGRSLGAVSLGMSAEKVKAVLGKADRESPGVWMEYKGKDGKVLVFFEDGSVSEIRFDSKKFKTEEGLSLANFEQKRWHDGFTFARLQTKFMNVRNILKSGGLAIYKTNLDGTEGNPMQTIGLVFAGHPRHQSPSYVGEPDDGWEAWDGTQATLWERMQHQNPGGINGFGLE